MKKTVSYVQGSAPTSRHHLRPQGYPHTTQLAADNSSSTHTASQGWLVRKKDHDCLRAMAALVSAAAWHRCMHACIHNDPVFASNSTDQPSLQHTTQPPRESCSRSQSITNRTAKSVRSFHLNTSSGPMLPCAYLLELAAELEQIPLHNLLLARQHLGKVPVRREIARCQPHGALARQHGNGVARQLGGVDQEVI